MTIAFETSTFVGQTDLLAKINTFITGTANANWSVSFNGAPTFDITENRLVLSHQSGAVKFAIQTLKKGLLTSGNVVKRMQMSAFTGTHDDTLDMDAQPGGYSDFDSISVQQTDSDDLNDAQGNPQSSLLSNYWFFLDDTYFIVILEIGQTSGFFQTFLWGQIDLYPGSANGYIIHGTIPRGRYGGSTAPRADYDNLVLPLVQDCFIGKKGFISEDESGHILDSAGVWQTLGATTNNSLVNSNGAFLSWHLGNNVGGLKNGGSNPKVITQVNWTTHTSNFIPPLIKGQVFSPHTSLGVINYAPMGEIPGSFMVPLDNGLAEGDAITIGLIDYLVFPAIRTRRVAHDDRYFGVAIQKNT